MSSTHIHGPNDTSDHAHEQEFVPSSIRQYTERYSKPRVFVRAVQSETYTLTDANGQTRTQTRQVQKTRWSRASGTVARDFDDLLVRGTSRVHAGKLDKLEPWPLAQAVPYQPDYLAGYTALPNDFNPYRKSFSELRPVSGVVLPAPGAYDIVPTSTNRSSSGRRCSVGASSTPFGTTATAARFPSLRSASASSGELATTVR